MYQLYIANKNYSSWSLRPWVLMRELHIGFVEHLLKFGETASWERYRTVSPTGKVPCLVADGVTVWDSLSIVEYLAERHPGIWPARSDARAWARSAAAEMHSGFDELRSRCSMSCGLRVRLNEVTPGLERDLARLDALWNDGLERFGGAFLAGDAFGGVDAFFAPVAFRIQTYGLRLGARGAAYAARLLDLSAMRSWHAEALAETFRDETHERENATLGTVLQDLRSV